MVWKCRGWTREGWLIESRDPGQGGGGEGVRRSLSDRGLSEEQGKVRARDRKEWRKFVNA